jgi:predicted metal-binding membrane protein
VSDAAEIAGATPSLRLAGVRRFIRSDAEWWVVAGSAVAWGAMISRPHPHTGHQGALATGLMIVAMMLPLTLPAIRHVSRSRPRAGRAVAGYLAGYLAVWMLGMLALTEAWALAAALAGWTAAAAGAVAAAALWELAPLRQREARRCERMEPLASHGWRAGADCTRFGATSGIRCFGMCWGVMVICVAFAHGVPLMAALFGVQLGGRYVPHMPRGLTALAILGVSAAAFAARIAT